MDRILKDARWFVTLIIVALVYACIEAAVIFQPERAPCEESWRWDRPTP